MVGKQSFFRIWMMSQAKPDKFGLKKEEPSISSISSKLILWVVRSLDTSKVFFFLSKVIVLIDPLEKNINCACFPDNSTLEPS